VPDVATSIRDVIEAGAVTLREAGIPESRRDALRIWSDLAGESGPASLLRQPDVAPDATVTRFTAAIHRRSLGEPTAYVTGLAGFRRLTIRCDSRALIPRPETEGLVTAALARVNAGVAADIGTGTGAIALALGDEGGYAEVIGVDVSGAALELAAENVAVTGLAVTLLPGDLVAPLAGREVDLLVSNPPYLTTAEHDVLDRSVRDYEPVLALVSGTDGLDATRRLLDEGRGVVRVGGWIALEVDCQRAAEVGRLAAALEWEEVIVLDDLFGRARYMLARRGNQ
jgi:release factor glutamine methyltransferase